MMTFQRSQEINQLTIETKLDELDHKIIGKILIQKHLGVTEEEQNEIFDSSLSQINKKLVEVGLPLPQAVEDSARSLITFVYHPEVGIPTR